MFAEIIGWETLEVLARRIDARAQRGEDGNRLGRLRTEVTTRDVLHMIGVHCMRATCWGERPQRPQRFYREVRKGRDVFGIGVANYRAMLHAMAELNSDELEEIQRSLSAALRAAFVQGGERVIDEWLDSFVHGNWYFVRENEVNEALKRMGSSDTCSGGTGCS